MPWKEADLAKLADELGVDINEIDQKLKLRDIIIQVRRRRGLTQAELAEVVGVSRSRIAQIEASVKLHRTSFDILLRVLQGLGYRYSISAKKSAA
jgi:transcriptional regulator with XRE-family HTH domain